MQALPFEIIEIVSSFSFDSSDLKQNICAIRYLNKHFFNFTETDRFWNVLVELQKLNNCNLHQWFYNILQIRKDTIENVILNSKFFEDKSSCLDNCEIFQHFVNKWIDLYCKCDSKLLQFLLKIAFSQNVVEFISPKNMIPCFHYLFFKLLEPTLQLIENKNFKEDIIIDNLFNLKLLNCLQTLKQEEENINNNCLVTAYWKVIDPIYSIFPRDLLLNIIDKLSIVRMNNLSSDNIASFIVKELYNCGLFMHIVDFKEEINFTGKNYKNLKPLFCKQFLLQHVACWKENEELLQFCLNPNNKEKQLDKIINNLSNIINNNNNLINSLTQEIEQDGIVSCFAMSNLTDNLGLTILHYAVKQGNLNLVKLLLKSNANPFSRSELHFVSPIELSLLLNKVDIFNLFKEIVGEQIVELHLKGSEIIRENLKKEQDKLTINKEEDDSDEEIEEDIHNNLNEIINLDEYEQQDKEKIISNKRKEKDPYLSDDYEEDDVAIAMRSDIMIEQYNYYSECIYSFESEYVQAQSDDDDDEEMINIKSFYKNNEINNNEIEDLRNCNSVNFTKSLLEDKVKEFDKIKFQTKPFEKVKEGHFMPGEDAHDVVTVMIGKRKYCTEESSDEESEEETGQLLPEKKLCNGLSDEKLNDENVDIIKRESLLMSKLPFRKLAIDISNQYSNYSTFTPMAFSFVQQSVENFGEVVFSIVNDIAKFYGRDYLNVKDIQLVKKLMKNNLIYKNYINEYDLMEFICWKLNFIELFKKMVENDSIITFENNKREISELLLQMKYEIDNFNFIESEDKEYDNISDTCSSDSNISTVALHHIFEKQDNYRTSDLVYLCDSKEKELKIEEGLYHSVETFKDEEKGICDNFYIEALDVNDRDEQYYAFTDSRELAIDWIDNVYYLSYYDDYFRFV